MKFNEQTETFFNAHISNKAFSIVHYLSRRYSQRYFTINRRRGDYQFCCFIEQLHGQTPGSLTRMLRCFRFQLYFALRFSMFLVSYCSVKTMMTFIIMLRAYIHLNHPFNKILPNSNNEIVTLFQMVLWNCSSIYYGDMRVMKDVNSKCAFSSSSRKVTLRIKVSLRVAG